MPEVLFFISILFIIQIPIQTFCIGANRCVINPNLGYNSDLSIHIEYETGERSGAQLKFNLSLLEYMKDLDCYNALIDGDSPASCHQIDPQKCLANGPCELSFTYLAPKNGGMEDIVLPGFLFPYESGGELILYNYAKAIDAGDSPYYICDNFQFPSSTSLLTGIYIYYIYIYIYRCSISIE